MPSYAAMAWSVSARRRAAVEQIVCASAGPTRPEAARRGDHVRKSELCEAGGRRQRQGRDSRRPAPRRSAALAAATRRSAAAMSGRRSSSSDGMPSGNLRRYRSQRRDRQRESSTARLPISSAIACSSCARCTPMSIACACVDWSCVSACTTSTLRDDARRVAVPRQLQRLLVRRDGVVEQLLLRIERAQQEIVRRQFRLRGQPHRLAGRRRWPARRPRWTRRCGARGPRDRLPRLASEARSNSRWSHARGRCWCRKRTTATVRRRAGGRPSAYSAERAPGPARAPGGTALRQRAGSGWRCETCSAGRSAADRRMSPTTCRAFARRAAGRLSSLASLKAAGVSTSGRT